jgi:CSLREA domain-containing protein
MKGDYRRMKTTLNTLLFMFALAVGATAATIVVDNTVDPGDGICASPGCTLREAITAANTNPGADIITFNIPGAGVHTITPTSALPTITETLTIDGYTQPGASENTLAVGNDAVLEIELDGTSAGFFVTGLVVSTDGCLIRGLVINRFGAAGIAVNGDNNVIEGNFLGTDPTGTADLGNAYAGVSFGFANDNNTVGGPSPGARNLIAGNGNFGVVINCCGDATGNTVQGNYIGTDGNGTAALPNDFDGIEILGAIGTQIGGTEPGAGNLISGNGAQGIYVTDPGGGDSGGNIIQGNLIGTDATGSQPLGNSANGVLIEDSPNNTVGGTVTGARNIISANGSGTSTGDSSGVLITGATATGNLVQGNFLGTDSSGNAGLGGLIGVEIAINASGNIIGGTTSGARNVISAHSTGVYIAQTGGNTVQGNYIGTNAAGSAPLGNDLDGVFVTDAVDTVIGGTVPGAGNVISGNAVGIFTFAHVAMGTTGTRIQGNFIGTDASGTAPLGNDLQGIVIGSETFSTTVGGPASSGNIIAFNAVGVELSGASPGTGNSIFGNSIFSNEGLGIDLGGDGVTANDFPDSDSGSNNLQNYPVLDQITVDGEARTVEGTLASNPNTDYVLNFYSDAEVDPSGYGEGETWFGSLDVHTNAQSTVEFSFPLDAGSLGRFITATATDPEGNTSEFSLASEIVPPLSRFLNISTRLRVQMGDNVLIGGFIIDGTDAKEVIVRAIGPSLGNFGVTDPLANPILELHYPDGTTVVTNNNWRDTQETEIMATGLAPNDDLESAILATLEPGPYTAIVRGVNGGTGIGLVETYDLDQAVDSSLANISTRGLVETGDNVMIGGIIVGPDGSPSGSILLRGIGPSLSDFGITNPLADPMLELRDGNGALIVSNDNWKSTQQAAIEDTGLAPNDDLESAILATLAAGSYTAILSGVGGTTGVALVEAYHLD